jgi:hypothetical protein
MKKCMVGHASGDDNANDDARGLWRMAHTCASLPCSKSTRLFNTRSLPSPTSSLLFNTLIISSKPCSIQYENVH